jgi:pimeloyl-ACP methyl ester carboxylesterase
MMVGNRAALAGYGGQSMSDPRLAGRLAAMTVPTLVIWSEADRIADQDYGRAFAAIPNGRFLLLHGTGHLPQIETPDQLLRSVLDFAASNTTDRPMGLRARRGLRLLAEMLNEAERPQFHGRAEPLA